jgi:hypothetical protein
MSSLRDTPTEALRGQMLDALHLLLDDSIQVVSHANKLIRDMPLKTDRYFDCMTVDFLLLEDRLNKACAALTAARARYEVLANQAQELRKGKTDGKDNEG